MWPMEPLAARTRFVALLLIEWMVFEIGLSFFSLRFLKLVMLDFLPSFFQWPRKTPATRICRNQVAYTTSSSLLLLFLFSFSYVKGFRLIALQNRLRGHWLFFSINNWFFWYVEKVLRGHFDAITSHLRSHFHYEFVMLQAKIES